jgi:cytochrome c oxidase subunit 3
MSEHLVIDRSHSAIEEQFEDRHQQKEAATLGMWTFLATEVLFFGGLFAGYTVYRHQHEFAFRQGSIDMKWYLGAINTAVLLLSSFFMALAVRAAARGSNPRIVRYLVLTIVVGTLFLCIKGIEYAVDYGERLVPGLNFTETRPTEEEMNGFTRAFARIDDWFDSHIGPPVGKATQRPHDEALFLLFYFIMTAIHATHMIIGIAVMLVLIAMARRGRFSAEWHNPVECFGLYWHFVDIVWVFLFPTLYLLRNP